MHGVFVGLSSRLQSQSSSTVLISLDTYPGAAHSDLGF